MTNVKNQNSDAQFWMYKLLLPKLQEPGKQPATTALGHKTSRKTSNCMCLLAGNIEPSEQKDRSEQPTLKTPHIFRGIDVLPASSCPTASLTTHWSTGAAVPLELQSHSSHWCLDPHSGHQHYGHLWPMVTLQLLTLGSAHSGLSHCFTTDSQDLPTVI